MANELPLKKITQHFNTVLHNAPALLGNHALNFFLDSFKRQAWIGTSIEPWKPRKTVTKWGTTPRNKGRALLVDTGRLRRSIRVIRKGPGMVTIGSDAPYAKAHNEGLRIGIIQHVGSYKRKLTTFGAIQGKALKSRSNVTFGRKQTGETTVAAHTRRVNMNIPKRQFMGESPVLTKQLTRLLTAELMKAKRYL